MAKSEILYQGAANKPIQFAGALLLLGTGVYFLSKKMGKSPGERTADNAENTVSKNNPFSYTEFLSQSIPAGTPMLKQETANNNAKKIYDSLNTYFSDSEDIVIGLFSATKNKVIVAQIAQAFFNLYKRDILSYLKTGNKTFSFGTGGLSDDNYNRVLTIVNQKPKF